MMSCIDGLICKISHTFIENIQVALVSALFHGSFGNGVVKCTNSGGGNIHMVIVAWFLDTPENSLGTHIIKKILRAFWPCWCGVREKKTCNGEAQATRKKPCTRIEIIPNVYDYEEETERYDGRFRGRHSVSWTTYVQVFRIPTTDESIRTTFRPAGRQGQKCELESLKFQNRTASSNVITNIDGQISDTL